MKNIWKKPAAGIVVIVLLCAIAVLFTDSPAVSNEQDTITLAMTLPPSILGRGSASVWDDLLRLQIILKKEYGLNLRIQKQVSWEKVIRMMEKGTADIAPLPPYYLAQARKQRPDIPITPLATFESSGSTNSRHCIYMLTGEKGLSEHQEPVDLLVGSRVSFPDEAEWAILNLIFRGSVYKFDASTYMYFFQSFRLLNREDAALAMVFGELDAVVMDEMGMKYVMEMDRRLEKSTAVECTGELPNTMIAARSNLDPALKKKIMGILSGMHNNPDFAPFRNFFKVTDGRWIDAEGINYEPWDEIARLSAGEGWDKFFATMPMGN